MLNNDSRGRNRDERVETTLTMPSTTSFLAALNTAGCRKYNAGALSMIKRKNSKKHTTRYKYVTAPGKEYVNK